MDSDVWSSNFFVKMNTSNKTDCGGRCRHTDFILPNSENYVEVKTGDKQMPQQLNVGNSCTTFA